MGSQHVFPMSSEVEGERSHLLSQDVKSEKVKVTIKQQY
ncbi:hypothetical protein PPEP_b0391 [Pseudoalteromonas peptidolytica F12-50-A1]|uniref:Uncharacterized protein n=1 Tax=Pseudoalteromonas peptidolytica F12-50-A1 TaxID=1315280 RepID=A0A8I0T6R9_9GAMM|nr:hypothetical protein [Pseudoalteromonas peptidolytica F12-50-A1]